MSVDMSNLPPDIRAFIEQEVAKALAANQPAPPPELTPAEKAALYLAQAASAIGGEKAMSAGSLYVHSKICDALAIVLDTVFAPPAQPAQPAQPVQPGAGTSGTPAASENGSAV